jgi:hypothetical protein
MASVFILWHRQPPDDQEDSKLIGVYATKEEAQAAAARLANTLAFAGQSNPFEILESEIGKDSLLDGLLTE